MAEINAAIDENLLDYFVLKSHQTFDEQFGFIPSVFCGQIKRKSAEKIFVKMFEESFSDFIEVCTKQTFDIQFCLNRTPYQLQHFALEILHNQHLFDALINNAKYDETETSSDTQPKILIE